MLKLQDLVKAYRTDEVETVALNNVNIEIEHGEFVAIMGPSGCGKSTLLNIIGMLDTPTSGHYFFKGEDVAGYSEAQLGVIRKQHIGFIFQSFNLIDELSVFENIELALLYHDIPASERKERVAAVMDKVGMCSPCQTYAKSIVWWSATTCCRGKSRGWKPKHDPRR